MKTAMKFKTLEGATKRARFENADAKYYGKPYRFRVIKNTDAAQIARGLGWRIEKEKQT